MQDTDSDPPRVYIEINKYLPKSKNVLKWTRNAAMGLRLGENECQSIDEHFYVCPMSILHQKLDPKMFIWGPIGSQVGAPIFQVNFVEGSRAKARLCSQLDFNLRSSIALLIAACCCRCYYSYSLDRVKWCNNHTYASKKQAP